jgi:hypothetical protein
VVAAGRPQGGCLRTVDLRAVRRSSAPSSVGWSAARDRRSSDRVASRDDGRRPFRHVAEPRRRGLEDEHARRNPRGGERRGGLRRVLRRVRRRPPLSSTERPHRQPHRVARPARLYSRADQERSGASLGSGWSRPCAWRCIRNGLGGPAEQCGSTAKADSSWS